jgi:hypothetical protein
MTDNKYDVVFSFDTTGSMSACIREVRKKITETTERLFASIPGIRIGVIAHGDYCDEHTTYLYKSLDLTNDKNAIINFINTTGDTGGGDYPEAYEYVLNKAQNLSWDSETMRCLVMIGDACPHPPNKNPYNLDWRNEVRELYKMNINIYSVQALSYGGGESYTFFKQIANMTNGYHLFLDQFTYIQDIFLAICYKQQSDEQVAKYEQEVIKRSNGLSISLRKFFDTLLKRKVEDEPIVERKGYYKDEEDEDEDDGGDVVPCPAAKYQVLKVDANASIRDFVLSNNLKFKVGKGFYEFTKSESIAPEKEVILMRKTTSELFEGKKAKRIAGITNENKKFKPKCLDEYKIFVQSTSYNRKLIGGTDFLYQAEDWGLHPEELA